MIPLCHLIILTLKLQAYQKMIAILRESGKLSLMVELGKFNH
jgi:hypothetical protein